MIEPTFKNLWREQDQQGNDAAGGTLSFAQNMHPNPRFYKYFWWVFHEDSPAEGRVFLQKEFRIPTAQAMRLVEDLLSKKKLHFLYNLQIPRKDPSLPFDPGADKWDKAEWALPYDEDPDELWNGHK